MKVLETLTLHTEVREISLNPPSTDYFLTNCRIMDFPLFLHLFSIEASPHTNIVFCSIVIQIFSLGNLWSGTE